MEDAIFFFGIGVIAGLIFGLVIGFFVGRKVKDRPVANWDKYGLAFIITAIWSISQIVAIFNNGYTTPWEVNVAFGSVVGLILQIPFVEYVKGMVGKK